MAAGQNGDTKELTVVAVAVDATCASSHPEQVMTALGEELSTIAGDKLIMLPPLLANVLVLPKLHSAKTLAKAVRRAGMGRWARRLAVWFTYPHANWRRRPWLVMHDEVHAALRTSIAGLAMATEASLVGGTALLSHPRTHWEAWPDHGELFHTAWSFGADGEPYDVIRQPRCHAAALADAGVDGNDELAVRVIHTPKVDVSPVWADTVPAAPVAWIPELTAKGDVVVTLADALAKVPGAQLCVRSALTGTMGVPLTGEAAIAVPGAGGELVVQIAPTPTKERPATWVSATISLIDDGAREEPAGAP